MKCFTKCACVVCIPGNNKELVLILCKILHNGFKREERHIIVWSCACHFPARAGRFVRVPACACAIAFISLRSLT